MDRKSFVYSKGQDCSEIDYFLVDASYQYCSQKKTIPDMPMIKYLRPPSYNDNSESTHGE